MMNYEKMLFFPKTEMSSITSFAAPPPPQSFASAQTQAEAATPSTAAAFLAPSDTYASYADNFDLSLLPLEGDSELSPAPSAHALNVSLDYIPTTVYRHTATPSTTTTSPDIKIEQTWPHTAASIKNEPPQSSAVIFEQLQEQRHQKVQRTKSESLLIPPPPYPHPYPSPESSPTQSDYSFHAQFGNAYSSVSCSRRSSSSLYPPSPCPSLDTTVIKQEFHILPPSPPESSCEAPSPHSFAVDVKAEPLDADVETLIDINSLLENTYHQFEQTGASEPEQKVKQESTQCCQDHQVLREYLEDTTFQKKHNLKPLALETLIGGLGARGDIEPVISLALEHAKREAEETCAKLQISPDPKTWSATQVHAWLRSTVEQFKLQQIDDLEIKFPGDGATLALLTEEEFVRRAPETGSTIHAQLEIWKLAYSNGFQDDYAANAPPESAHSNGANGPSAWPPECGQQQNSELRMDEGSDDDDDDADASPPTTVLTATATPTSSVDGANAAAVHGAKPLAATPTRNGGAHIHLWQFLKELLAAPHVNGTAIRWIERSRGVFKIEDSVRVAKLWGRRKNRPAMNYDKLSRSIRQYYKKGIMKKTERSQRLVYQFCHPYNL